MQIEQKSENFISSEGKFFKAVEEDSNGVKTYRQLELYLPGDVSTYCEPLAVTRARWLEELERGHIIAVLERTRWRISGKGGAADILGLVPTTLHSRMKKLGISRSSA